MTDFPAPATLPVTLARRLHLSRLADLLGPVSLRRARDPERVRAAAARREAARRDADRLLRQS